MFAVTSFALWLTCLAFVAKAFPLAPRDVVVPRITSPTKDSVWPVGSVQTVTWDTSNFPPDDRITNPLGRVLLGFDENDSLNLDINNPLAQGFSIKDGSVQVTVPNVPPKDNYLIVLMGNSGNASPVFTITRITGPSSPSSSSSSATSSSSQAPAAPSPATPSPPSANPNTPAAPPANPVAGPSGSTSTPTGDGGTPAQPTSPSPTPTAPVNSDSDTTDNATGAASSIHSTGLFGLSALSAGAVSFTLLLLM